MVGTGLAYVSSSVTSYHLVRGCTHWWSVYLACALCRSPSHLVPPSRIMCHRLSPSSTVCALYMRVRDSSYPKKRTRGRLSAHRWGSWATSGQIKAVVFQQKTNKIKKNCGALSACNYSRFFVCGPMVAKKSFFRGLQNGRPSSRFESSKRRNTKQTNQASQARAKS